MSHVEEVHLLMLKGGFNLTKWISNSREVLESIPVEVRAKDVKEHDLDNDALPTERALGVSWFVETDIFGFKVNIKEKPCTNRGILYVYQCPLSVPRSCASRFCGERASVGMTRFPETTYLGGGCGLMDCQNFPLSQLIEALSTEEL